MSSEFIAKYDESQTPEENVLRIYSDEFARAEAITNATVAAYRAVISASKFIAGLFHKTEGNQPVNSTH